MLMNTDDMIESIVAVAGDDARAKHFLRESLRNLVRLAKIERGIESQALVAPAESGNSQTIH